MFADAKRGRAFALPRQYCEARTSSRPALEHDSEGDRNECHVTSLGRNAVIARFDKRVEYRQRQVDSSAGVPTEVVLGRARKARGRYGRHIQSTAADQIRRHADARQTPHDVARRAHDVELGTTSCLLVKRVVRAIDAKTNGNEREVDAQGDGTDVAGLGRGGQVAHGGPRTSRT